jgi:hypothetical protein
MAVGLSAERNAVTPELTAGGLGPCIVPPVNGEVQLGAPHAD